MRLVQQPVQKYGYGKGKGEPTCGESNDPFKACHFNFENIQKNMHKRNMRHVKFQGNLSKPGQDAFCLRPFQIPQQDDHEKDCPYSLYSTEQPCDQVLICPEKRYRRIEIVHNVLAKQTKQHEEQQRNRNLLFLIYTFSRDAARHKNRDPRRQYLIIRICPWMRIFQPHQAENIEQYPSPDYLYPVCAEQFINKRIDGIADKHAEKKPERADPLPRKRDLLDKRLIRHVPGQIIGDKIGHAEKDINLQDFYISPFIKVPETGTFFHRVIHRNARQKQKDIHACISALDNEFGDSLKKHQF